MLGVHRVFGSRDPERRGWRVRRQDKCRGDRSRIRFFRISVRPTSGNADSGAGKDQPTPPHIITAEELTDALFSLLPRNDSDWMDGDAFENVYPAYVNRVRSLASHRVSRPFAIAQLPVRPASDRTDAAATVFLAGWRAASAIEQDEPIDEEARHAMESLSKEDHFEIWSGNEICVGMCGTGRPDIDPEFAPKNVSGYPDLLYAIVRGRISPSAMEVLAKELRAAI